LWINQQAVIARTSLEVGNVVSYTLQNPGHGVYVFVIEGKANIGGVVLSKRDGMGIEGVKELVCQGIESCDVLLIEVPMQFV
jgi:redox-sensitive bicupin YhaK (pirin superfamily)